MNRVRDGRLIQPPHPLYLRIARFGAGNCQAMMGSRGSVRSVEQK